MLLKNTIATFRKKWIQLLATGLIIILSSMLYTMMSYSLSGIEKPTLQFLKDYRQEDFSVDMLNIVTDAESRDPAVIKLLSENIYAISDIKKRDPNLFYSLMDARKKAFENIYKNYSLELREYKQVNYEFNGENHKALIVKNARMINKAYIEAGSMPVNKDEIAINKIYAEKNSISLGDYLEIDNARRLITGFVLFPDYTFPMFDNSLNVDTSLQTMILAAESDFEGYNAKEAFHFAGINLRKTDSDAFSKEVIDTFRDYDELSYITDIISTNNRLRSGAIFDELLQGKVMALGLGIFITIIAIIIICIILYNLLHAERGQIGILKALGYSRLKIALPYFLSIIIAAFVMLVTGYILGSVFAGPMKRLYLDFYLLPSVGIRQSIFVFSTAIMVPLALIAVFSGTLIFMMLKARALELLRPHENQAINFLSRIVSRLLVKAKGRTKFKYLYVIRNTGSFFVFFLGIMTSTILINFSFMTSGIVERMTTEYLNKVDYQYESYIDLTQGTPEVKDGEEKFLAYPYATLDGSIVSISGLSPENKLYKLYDTDGNNITDSIKTGAVITNGLSMKQGLEAGDSISVKIGKNYHDFVISGVTDEYIMDKLYLEIKELSSILSENKSTELFSGIYSIDKPDSESYNIIMKKSDIIAQSKAMEDFINIVVFMLIGGSVIIAVSILYVLTSLSVENNYYVISLLKVMGYNRREVNSMIINSYFTYTLISYLVSLPISLLVLRLIMNLFIREYGILLPMEFKPVHIAAGLVILICIFFAGTIISRRKISKIPLQEILKAYEE